MVALKREAIVFSPGIYEYAEGPEKKVIEDLREMAELPLIYPITYGHPGDGVPDREDVIGTWKPKSVSEEGKVRADIWLFPDKRDKYPEEIWTKAYNYQPLGVSPGYKYNRLTEEGAQLGTLPNHLAIAKIDGEDPRCPLGECGINVRMDSENDSRVRYDQIFEMEFIRPENVREDSEEVEAPDAQEPETVEAEPEPTEETPPAKEPESSEEVSEESEPAEQKPEVAIEEAPADIPREPETVIPPSVTAPDSGEFEEIDGWVTYTPKVYRDNKNGNDSNEGI